MSKLFYERLSPRDRACIEYGRQLEYLLCYKYPYRHDEDYTDFDEIRGIINDCRAARERIFRNCAKCRYCKDFRGFVNNKTHYDCSFNPFIPEDKAITCQYYEERREK